MPKTLTTVILAVLASFAAWLSPAFPHISPVVPRPIAQSPPRSAHQSGHVTVVLDTSGSMSDRGKLSYAKQLVRTLNLRARGTVSVVAFADRARTVLAEDEQLDDAALAERLYDVTDGGSSNLYDGLRVAIETSPLGSDILVVSDGAANAGRTTPDALQALADRLGRNGGRLYTVSLSPDADGALLPLSRTGGGVHRFVERPRDLVSVLDERAFATLGVAQ
ncbi:MAG: Mg-chelatase subunit ChlD [Myxococcota bacterium]|jgi:Mg-chelatase subunit ChlD